MSEQEEQKQSRYYQRKEKNDEYRKKIMRFTFQLSLHDGEVREWFEQHPDKGAYLKSLILADKSQKMKELQAMPDLKDTEIEKRMADGYEITQAIHIGDREIVFGMDDTNEFDLKYLCGYYQSNELFGQYFDCKVSTDYVEVVKLFAERVSEQCDKVRAEQEKVTVPMEVITAEQCIPDDYSKNIEGKVIVIRPEVLRGEYQTADRQLWLCRGGFGSHANSRGSACFCVNLYSGKESRWERRDVLGEMKELPDWAKERLAVIQAERAKKSKPQISREDR